MPKLSDTQLVILSAAAKRDDGSILPLPRKLKLKGEAETKVLKDLAKKKLAEERNAVGGDHVWRDEDGRRLMLAITGAGLSAIGVEGPAEAEARFQASATKARSRRGSLKKPQKSPSTSKTGQKAHAGASSSRAKTKQAGLIEMLRRPAGATIEDLAKATGWQTHSVRGVISGVLKKQLGMTVVSDKNDSGERRYRLAE